MKIIILLFLFLIGCSQNSENQSKNISSDIQFISQADLGITGSLDFGTIPVQSVLSKIITLKNNGVQAGRVKPDLTNIYQTNGVFSINYGSSDCFISNGYKVLQPGQTCQIEMLLNAGQITGNVFTAIPLYDELAANTLITSLQVSAIIADPSAIIPPTAKSCQTNYHKDPITNKCVSDYKDCTPTITYATSAKKHWVNGVWGSCIASACNATYTPANGGTSCQLNQYTLIINKLINQGSVDVTNSLTSTLIGSCPLASTSCSLTIPGLTGIKISSTPTAGYSFTNYADITCLGTNSNCTLSGLNSNITVNPIFSLVNYSLTTIISPILDQADTTLTITKNGAACTGSCLTSFHIGDILSIISSPDQYVLNSTMAVTGSGYSNLSITDALITLANGGKNKTLGLTWGSSDITTTITLNDRAISSPSFSFNGTLTGSAITLLNNPLTITTTNATMAREMLISESSDCSVGSYVAFNVSQNFTHSNPIGVKPISIKLRNNTQTSACYPYTLQVTNISRACLPQPLYTSINGTQSSTNNGTTWGSCIGYTCQSGYTDFGNGSCLMKQSCNITDGTSTITGIGTQTSTNGTTWTACSIVSCNANYHTENNTTCISNTKSCIITHGTGAQSWTGSSWSSCSITACDPTYTPYNNSCTPILSKVCTSQPTYSSGGLQYSYDAGATYGSCTGFTCSTNYHTEDGLTCISNTRSCTITHGIGSQTWAGTSWNSCSIVSCDPNYTNSGSACTPSPGALLSLVEIGGTGAYLNVVSSVLDQSGNMYILSSISNQSGAGVVGPFGTQHGSLDAIVFKYNSAGVFQWAKQFGGISTTTQVTPAQIVYKNGTLYVVGSTTGMISFGGIPLQTGTIDAFVVRMSSTDGSAIGISQIGQATSATKGYAVQIDSSDRFYIIGTNDGGGKTGYLGQKTGSRIYGGTELLVVQYNSAGTYLYSQTVSINFMNSMVNGSPKAIIDGSGKLTVAANFTGSSNFGASISVEGLSGSNSFIDYPYPGFAKPAYTNYNVSAILQFDPNNYLYLTNGVATDSNSIFDLQKDSSGNIFLLSNDQSSSTDPSIKKYNTNYVLQNTITTPIISSGNTVITNFAMNGDLPTIFYKIGSTSNINVLRYSNSLVLQNTISTTGSLFCNTAYYNPIVAIDATSNIGSLSCSSNTAYTGNTKKGNTDILQNIFSP